MLNTGLGFTGDSKHQNKVFPYGSLQPQAAPAKFVVAFANGQVDLPTDLCCLSLVSKVMGVRIGLLGAVQLRGSSLPELLPTRGCAKRSASSDEIFWLV